MEMPTETLTCCRVEDEPTYLIHIQHPTGECYDVTADEPVLKKHSTRIGSWNICNQEQLAPISRD